MVTQKKFVQGLTFPHMHTHKHRPPHNHGSGKRPQGPQEQAQSSNKAEQNSRQIKPGGKRKTPHLLFSFFDLSLFSLSPVSSSNPHANPSLIVFFFISHLPLPFSFSISLSSLSLSLRPHTQPPPPLTFHPSQTAQPHVTNLP